MYTAYASHLAVQQHLFYCQYYYPIRDSMFFVILALTKVVKRILFFVQMAELNPE